MNFFTSNVATPNGNNQGLKIVLIVAIIFLLITSGTVVYFIYQKMHPATGLNQTNSNTVDLDQSLSAQLNNDTTSQVMEEFKPSNEPANEQIMVSWYDVAKSSDYLGIDIGKINDRLKTYQYFDQDAAKFWQSFTFYLVGKVESGKYQGGDVYVATFTPEGPAMRKTMYRLIKLDQDLIFLSQQSDSVWDYYAALFDRITDGKIGNLETTPLEIPIPNSALKLVKAPTEPLMLMSEYGRAEKIFRYDNEHYVYKNIDKNCFVVEAPDGTVREYYFNLPFISNTNEHGGPQPAVAQITWSDGSTNTDEFSYRSVGGCGYWGCYNYPVDYKVTKEKLKEIGRTASGDPVFEQKSLDSLQVANVGKGGNQVMSVLEYKYEQYYPGYQIEKVSLEEFIASHPVFYWQDPFGNFIEFSNMKYVPAAECGKPVIYLYPKTETDVSVQVAPNGGLSLTEPAYGNGWLVKARPSGELYNYSDRQMYPYLFWEGYGLNYQQPDEGFVVARNEVKDFLIDSLAKLGLVKAEYDAFIDFWLPRMQAANYYLISFVPQSEFDRLAPLKVQPKPDTVIRVFMDYQPLDHYVEVVPQKLSAPTRTGFTVVEWGGALHD